ncbi:hypothetical protein KL86APRO_10487 [uncultured Alphaproteobacteria bacterium]|uniref:Holin n=1 Tax=uncultured Alphaproteobacteria bacterium TaxID=91750 RepID=A0A212J459_9PROT|nr:hypothetical protein KL86APRO_10487 [uncultured Alphaproteobacteria bacterium]
MQEEITAAAKMAPAGIGAIWAGLTLNEWVAVVTILYVLAQTGLLIPRWCAMLAAFFARLRSGKGAAQ